MIQIPDNIFYDSASDAMLQWAAYVVDTQSTKRFFAKNVQF